MSKIEVSLETAREIAKYTRLRGDGVRAVCKSLLRDGVHGTVGKFPHIPHSIVLRIANVLTQNVAPVRDLDTRVFSTAGLRWSMPEPSGLDDFKVAISYADSVTRCQLRVSFRIHDAVSGEGRSKLPKPTLLRQIESDSVLRMNVSRAVVRIAHDYLADALDKSQEIPRPILQHAPAVAQSILSLTRVFPHINLRARVLPTPMCEIDDCNIGVDVTFVSTVELYTPERSEGNSFSGVGIQDNAAYFEIASSVQSDIQGEIKQAVGVLQRQPEEKYHRAAHYIEGISSQRRRKREHEVLEKGPPGATRREVIQVGGPEDATTPKAVDIVIQSDGSPELVKVASLQSDVADAAGWWRGHKGLIKPSLGDIATDTMTKFGEAPSKNDVDLLVDMSLPTLGSVTKRRKDQFMDLFGVDVATAALATLLRREFQKRLT